LRGIGLFPFITITDAVQGGDHSGMVGSGSIFLRSWMMCWSRLRVVPKLIDSPGEIEQLVTDENLALMPGEEKGADLFFSRRGDQGMPASRWPMVPG
jgi:hypothetical protein